MCGLICMLGMAKLSSPKYRLVRIMCWLQMLVGGLVLVVNIYTLYRLHTAGFFFYNDAHFCGHNHGVKGMPGGFDVKEMTQHIKKVLQKMETLQLKLEDDVLKMSNNNIPKLEFKKYLEEVVVQSLFGARLALRQIRLPRVEGTMKVNEFMSEEIRKYITPKENRKGKINTYRMARIHNTIGHVCVLVKKELEEYMNYEVGSYCKDDWNFAQDLMLKGCDPLPQRRCLTRGSKLYLKPRPINESLWKVPGAGNVRWSHYSKCKDFECLSRSIEWFQMGKEKLRWINTSKISTDFLIKDVLAVKPGEIRIGLDYSVGTGTFAARMMEHNVTVISAALNLGAPFNEMIALRGLVPLYVTPNQRLPFFENTLDLIHTTGFLDGGRIDMLLLDFTLFDWDRILRPRGLLWIDKFLCSREDMEDYMYMFLQFRYKKHRWVISSKSKEEVYLSALLEKPLRSV